MQKYELSGLEALMPHFGITTSEDFQAYWNQVLSPLENQELNIEGFVWSDPQVDFTYKMAELEDTIEVMATYVDLDSEAIPFGGKAPINELTGSIPRAKARAIIGEEDYRKELITLNNLRTAANLQRLDPNTTVEAYLQEYLFDKLSTLANAHKGTLNYQVGQMKSAAKLELTDTNNPRGIKAVTFSANVPDENFKEGNWFYVNGTTGKLTPVEGSKPITDIKHAIFDIKMTKARFGLVVVEIDEQFALDMLNHPEFATAIGHRLNPSLLVTEVGTSNARVIGENFLISNSLDELKSVFKALIGADEVIYHRTVCGVEKFNTTTKALDRVEMKAFDYGTILIRPAGVIGKIVNTVPMRPDGSAISAGIFGNRGIVEYIYDAKHRVQDWRSEMTCLAVPTRPRDMYYFNAIGEEPSGD